MDIEDSQNQSLLRLKPKGKSFSGVSGLSLSCWYTNATSLNSGKLNDLRAECIDTDYDIRFVTETWFNQESVVNIDGYDCFRRDRSDKKGGGVCIYTRSSETLSFRETNYDQLNSSSIEQVWCVADTGGESILLGCIYRPKLIKDNKGIIASVEEHKKRDRGINNSIRLANKLVKKGVFQGIILAGDFNYGELTWNESLEPEVLIKTESSDCFLDCLTECFLVQNVFFKTFQQDDSRLTNLSDLVITESKERIYELKPGPILGGQDFGHLSLSWRYGLKVSVESGKRFRKTRLDFKNGDYVGMKLFFGCKNWAEIFEEVNVGVCYKKFLGIYNEACDKFIPKIRVNPNHKPKPPWLTREIREMMRQKCNLWHSFVSGGRRNEVLHEEYKVQCKLVKSSISRSISSFELELAKNSVKNPKGLFTYINKKQKMKESIRSLNDLSGASTTDKAEMAEIISNQFASVFSMDDGNEPIFENRTEYLCSEEGIISRCDLLERLNRLDCSKAPGRDKVSQHILKNFSVEILVPLEFIFNKSLNEGEISDEWREANLTPLFKKGSLPVSMDSFSKNLVSQTS